MLPEGYSLTGASLYMFGLCPQCNKPR
jgi:hypothetical protein